MKNPLYLLAFLCTCTIFSQSKPFKISGVLISDDDRTPLESATVYLETLKDSTLVTYTITDKNGAFVLENRTPEDRLNLTISYLGYEPYSKTISLGPSPINLNTIALESANLLDEIVIRSRAPVTIKKDTLEFNVASFKTKRDANVEDLLKELPGVEVEDDGTIKVNGKDVNKILVNGKPFFGDDPTITTRNLTKDLIEKIQITDTKTKAQAFSGEKGDGENKTINLTIREENNRGVFGRVSAGAGTDRRYEYAGMVNLFDNEQRLSLLVGGNNINSSGFSFGEIRRMFGGGQGGSSNRGGGSFSIGGRSFGGGQGITTSNTAGINYADQLGKDNDLSGDYFYSGSQSTNATTTERESFLPNTSYFTSSTSRSQSDTDNHSANINFDIKIDSTFMVNIRPSFRFTTATTTFEKQESSRDGSNLLTNTSETASLVKTLGKNFGNRLNLTKRFGQRGAFIRAYINTEVNSTNTEDHLDSETYFYDENSDDVIRKQFTDNEQSSNTLGMGATYRLPLKAKNWFLDFNYGYTTNTRRNIRSTFDFDETTDDYDAFNTLLSTNFTNTNQRHNPNVKLVHNTDKMTFRLGSGYTSRTIENTDKLRPELSLKRNFDFLELEGDINYRFSPKSSFNIRYDFKNDIPSIAQLQPFLDVSDPLNTIMGNPSLRPSERHDLNFGFNNFDYQKRTGFYIWASANIIQNQVVSISVVDENLVKSTTYTNVNGNYSANLGSHWNKDFRLNDKQSLKTRLGLSGSLNRQVNFNNGIEYTALSNRLNPLFELTYLWNKLFEVRPSYRLSFTNTKYNLDNLNDRNFVSHRLGIRTATFFPEKLEWRNEINYTYNPNVAQGFQKSAWFWNTTLTYAVLQDNGNISLKVYDLLNQNTNAQRTTTDNYIQDSQSTVLEQYFMLSFSWKFNTLGAKGEPRGRDRRYLM